MKKIYTTPKIETIAIFSEQAILAGSGGGSNSQAIQNTTLKAGDEIGEGWYSGKKIWNQNGK